VPTPQPAPVDASHLRESILPYVRRDVITLGPQQTIADALETVRSNRGDQPILYLYVVDEARRLCGIVPTRRLLTSQPTERIAHIMIADVIAIPSWATVLVASEFFVNRRFLAFPVIEDDGAFIGAVDVSVFTDDVVTMARESFEDIFQIIGVHVTQSRSPWTGFKDRFPWLLCNIGGGLLCAVIAGLYEPLLQALVVLALFIPVVLALSESVSMQSATLTLQALHGGSFDRNLFLRAVRRELLTAILLGLTCGAIVAGVCAVWQGQWLVAGAIGASIWISMVMASLFGLALPTLLHALKADPRIAAGPIVLASADVATLACFFNLAGWLTA
jgi:magnesium transporter